MEHCKLTIHCSLDDLQGHTEVDCCDIETFGDVIEEYCRKNNITNKQKFQLQSADSRRFINTSKLKSSNVKENDVLYLVYVKSSNELTIGKAKHLCTLAILCLIIFLGLVVSVLILKLSVPKCVEQYGVVLDAGSSHTKCFIYEWPGQKLNNTGIVSQLWVSNSSGEGISYFDNPDDAGKSIKDILKDVKHNIKNPSSTTIYLGATAGMRLLEMRDKQKAHLILSSVRNVIQNSGFKIRNMSSDISIISGREEAADAWTSVNYIFGSFGNFSLSTLACKLKNIVFGNSLPDTTGALDMGGASTQITFHPNMKEGHIPKNYSNELNLYGWSYNIYTHSYICYGLDEIKRRYLFNLLASNSSGNGPILSPCFLKGHVENITSNYLFKEPCTPATLKNRTKHWYVFVGTSDHKECSMAVDKLFNWDAYCPYGKNQCSFNGIYHANLSGNFIAFSGFCYPLYFSNLTDCNGMKFSYHEFKTATEHLCSITWSELTTKQGWDKFTLNYCLQMHYFDKLLVKGYKFIDKNWDRLTFQKTIRGNTIGWALGFMLRKTNNLPKTLPIPFISLAVFVILICLAAIFFIFSLIYFFIWRWFKVRSKSATKNYERLNLTDDSNVEAQNNFAVA